MTTAFETIALSAPAPHVAVVTLNRPQAANAFNTRMALELTEAFLALKDERCVILTGAGERAFCAGADLRERHGMSDEAWAAQHVVFEAMGRAILGAPMPVIAAVNGAAYGGGCEIALLCDIVHASETARFALTEATLGIMPGLGATQTLTRAAGAGRAKQVILTGAPFSAAEALAWGVVNQVAPSGRVLDGALDVAARIAANAPLAVRAIKRAIDDGESLDLDRGMALELEQYNRLFPTRDRLEGVRAFNEKRRPDFKGE
ncbi:MAG: enoyl-CoA hydratase-related protein [Caulobacteraceae bacterium]